VCVVASPDWTGREEEFDADHAFCAASGNWRASRGRPASQSRATCRLVAGDWEGDAEREEEEEA
jgi:hypothetical protein